VPQVAEDVIAAAAVVDVADGADNDEGKMLLLQEQSAFHLVQVVIAGGGND
jgi:hypothetical protein